MDTTTSLHLPTHAPSHFISHANRPLIFLLICFNNYFTKLLSCYGIKSYVTNGLLSDYHLHGRLGKDDLVIISIHHKVNSLDLATKCYYWKHM